MYGLQLLVTIAYIILIKYNRYAIYVTGFAKGDLFDRFFKIEFSSHSSATGIALNGDLIKAYHTVQLSRKTGLIMQ